MIPQFQLVIQFPEWHMDFDSLIQLEMSLVAKLGEEVDGHDLGSGEANIFILTSQPEQAFCVVRNVLSNEQLINAKVAYRPLMGDEYTILWPPDLREFAVK